MSFWLIPILIFVAFIIWKKRAKRRDQISYIDNYVFPEKISVELKIRYPHLQDPDVDRVIEGLRQYFLICRGHRSMVAMPSQVVDIAWHEFILFTRHYEQFCNNGLGRFLHHTPAEVMPAPTSAQDSIKLAWRLACQLENIDPKHPKRLPLLFALDAELEIADGFFYSLNCTGRKNDGYCASHIGCSGGGTSCGGDSDGGGGCGGD